MKGPDRSGSFAYQTAFKIGGMAVEGTIIFNGVNKALHIFVPPECLINPNCISGVGAIAFGIAILVTGMTPVVTKYLTRGGYDS